MAIAKTQGIGARAGIVLEAHHVIRRTDISCFAQNLKLRFLALESLRAFHGSKDFSDLLAYAVFHDAILPQAAKKNGPARGPKWRLLEEEGEKVTASLTRSAN